MDVSHRVPQRLLVFSEYIASLLSVQDGVHCKSTREGGDLKYIVQLDELIDEFKPDESYLFLARNRKFFKVFEDWCKEQCLPYTEDKDGTFPSMADKVNWRDGRLEEIEPETRLILKDYEQRGTLYRSANIRISTIHGVKGDEADNVVLLSDVSRLVYNGMSIDEDAEHRVFYVAVTRAKRRLYIVQPQTRYYYPYIF